ncbi:MAG: hypothetical protein Q4F54_04840 [Coriobacteriia bacterium]|nr:hypothetical protein [Coriobacteriia bacterium]
MRSDYTAKAVYQKNNSAYDGHNTLSFYFDNIDHNSEGDVYEVNSSFVDTSSRYVNLPS